MMTKASNLKSHLKIDKNNLDEAIQRQPLLYYEVAQKHALAVSQRDEKYDAVKVTDALLSLEIRERFNEEGVKATEALVTAKVLEHTEHSKVVTDHMRAKYIADELLALKESFSQRSYMLRELVELYVSGYYTSDSVQPKRLGKPPPGQMPEPESASGRRTNWQRNTNEA